MHRPTLRLLLPLLACLAALPVQAETLREVVQANGIPLPADVAGSAGIPDRPITSYAVLDDEQMFAIAYDWQGRRDRLPDSFRVSLFDKGTQSWTHAELPRRQEGSGDAGPSRELGSLVGLSRTDRHLYLSAQSSPSAGTLLILTRALRPVGTLDGWLLAALPDDTVLYHRSMPHFAPTHPAELWLYQPATGQDMKLYPAPPYQPVRLAYIDEVRGLYEKVGEEWFRANNHPMDPERFDSSLLGPFVVNAEGSAVAFVARFGSDKSSPAATPVRDVVVVCQEITSAAPQCSEQPLAELQDLHPGLADREALLRETLLPVR